MQAANKITMKVLSDGTISISTDSFSDEVHQQAEELINETIELLGGERQTLERKDPEYQNHNHSGGFNRAGH